MRRVLLSLLVALSLLPCVAASLLWGHGVATFDANTFNDLASWSSSPRRHFALMTGRSQLLLTQNVEEPTTRPPLGATSAEEAAWASQFGRNTNRRLLGFGVARRVHVSRTKDGRMYYSGWERWVTAPHWAVVLATGAPPVLWLVRRRVRGRRRDPRLCPTCGYDLRATPGRCPECGWKRPLDNPSSESITRAEPGK